MINIMDNYQLTKSLAVCVWSELGMYSIGLIENDERCTFIIELKPQDTLMVLNIKYTGWETVVRTEPLYKRVCKMFKDYEQSFASSYGVEVFIDIQLNAKEFFEFIDKLYESVIEICKELY